MSLFQKSIVKKYSNELNKVLIDTKYREFQRFFANSEIQQSIRNATDEQFQQQFLQALFVSTFDYTLAPHPHFNLTTKVKNPANNNTFQILKDDLVIAIIELVSAKIHDLDKIEATAFETKNKHSQYVYIISSNFLKLRFYIHNAVDFMEFDLFHLTREQFYFLWLCLAKDNLLNGLAQKMKEESVLHEENITKQLYADYSKFRDDIYSYLIKNNPLTDKITLFKKTQKLLDRFLFLFFAENKQLIPANTTTQIIEKWKGNAALSQQNQLYTVFKQYFTVLHTGRPKNAESEKIFAYNGGLFAPDEILDSAAIDNDILYKHALVLCQYDFELDVDVNILGHIFENSLAQIEILKAEINGVHLNAQKTKRKKDGIFYTPKYITKYIVENTVGRLCKEKRKALNLVAEEYYNANKDTITALDNKLTEYRNWLLKLTIIDPACGSGAFLNQALDFLITEHQKIDDLKAQLLGEATISTNITPDILEKNIYGVDLNEESIEIAKLSLWLQTAQKGRKLNQLNNNIKCGNSLVDDPNMADDKAFNWQKQFPEVFAQGGFDVVIGNPPYVRRTELPNDIKGYFEKKYYSAYKQYDLYVLFNELAINIVKPNSYIGFIQPNKFLSAEYGFKINNLLVSKTKIVSVYDVSLDKIFEAASVYPYIFIYQKKSTPDSLSEQKINLLDYCSKDGLKGFDTFFTSVNVIKKIQSKAVSIKSIAGKIKRGLPYSKLIFNSNGQEFGIKSTDLPNGYYQPRPSIRFNYKSIDERLVKNDEFSKKLILLPRTVLKIRAIIHDKSSHILDRIYYLSITDTHFLTNYVVAILNSQITTFYYNHLYSSTKIGGGYIDLKGTQIENLLIPRADKSIQTKLAEKAEQMNSLYKLKQEKTTAFSSYVQSNLNTSTVNKKLQNGLDLDFSTFISELKKHIRKETGIDLSPTDETNWMQIFESKKEEILTIQAEQNNVDRKINQMVYALFELNYGEIETIETSK
jgi:type I restriction-modification system DNA methylase subunit